MMMEERESGKDLLRSRSKSLGLSLANSYRKISEQIFARLKAVREAQESAFGATSKARAT